MSDKDIWVDIRIIAATNRDLESMCAQGTFREDLQYRFNALALTISWRSRCRIARN